MSRVTSLWGCVQVLLVHCFTSASARGLQLHRHAASASPLCLRGRAVPELYLLGAMKSGTTSLAFDLTRAGLRSGIEGEKELHAFDRMCGVGKNTVPFTCDNFTKQDISMWFEKFERCKNGVHTKDSLQVRTDMTPINLRLKRLPGLLHHIYGEDVARELKFVVELRDPMARMLSHYYHVVSKGTKTKAANASQWAESIMREAAYLQRQSSSYMFDVFYRSLYGKNLQQWLEKFQPRQFVIVPMRAYFKSLKDRQAVIDVIGTSFGLSLNSAAIQHDTHLNVGSAYPDASELLTESQRRWFNSRFAFDAKHLSAQLANGMKDGLVVAGYTGPADAASVLKYLSESW